MKISYFSTVALQTAHSSPQSSFADSLLSFDGRKFTLVEDVKSFAGFYILQEEAPFRETAGKIVLFVFLLLTVVGAFVLLIQKCRYRSQISNVLDTIQKNWFKKRDAMAQLHISLPHLISEDMVSSWFEQNIFEIKRKAANEQTALNFYHAFQTDDDFAVLIHNGRRWKINRYVASLHSDFIKKALSNYFKEGTMRAVELKKADGESFSDLAMNIFISYLDTGSSAGITFENDKIVFELAHQLQILKLLNEARRVLIKKVQKEKNPKKLVRFWQWVKKYPDSLKVHCAHAFMQLPNKNYFGSGFLLEASEIINFQKKVI